MNNLINPAQLQQSLTAMGENAAESLRLLLEIYEADAPNLLADIRQAIADGDFDGLRFAAHSLKSSSATLGASRLATLCQQLEYQARAQSDRGLMPLYAQIETTYRQTITALQRSQFS